MNIWKQAFLQTIKRKQSNVTSGIYTMTSESFFLFWHKNITMSVNLNFSIGFFTYHTSVLSYAHCTPITTTFMLAYIFSWSEIVCFCGSTAPSSLRSKPALPDFMGEDIIGLYLSFSSSWDLKGPVKLRVCSSCNTSIPFLRLTAFL